MKLSCPCVAIRGDFLLKNSMIFVRYLRENDISSLNFGFISTMKWNFY